MLMNSRFCAGALCTSRHVNARLIGRMAPHGGQPSRPEERFSLLILHELPTVTRIEHRRGRSKWVPSLIYQSWFAKRQPASVQSPLGTCRDAEEDRTEFREGAHGTFRDCE